MDAKPAGIFFIDQLILSKVCGQEPGEVDLQHRTIFLGDPSQFRFLDQAVVGLLTGWAEFRTILVEQEVVDANLIARSVLRRF